MGSANAGVVGSQEGENKYMARIANGTIFRICSQGDRGARRFVATQQGYGVWPTR